MAANPQDRWAFALDFYRLAVITRSGQLFVHTMDRSNSANTISNASVVPGSNGAAIPIGAQNEDWWVTATNPETILVGRRDGGVFSHSLDIEVPTGRPYGEQVVKPAIQINAGGPPFGYNPDDQFVVFMGLLVVITEEGSVWSHDISRGSFAPHEKLGELGRVAGRSFSSSPEAVRHVVGVEPTREGIGHVILIRKSGAVVDVEVTGFPVMPEPPK
ncbi:hypothetical protein [Paenarthrobacter sp. Z7-10]|uniref:hypothetical protein n=1 Tax=Paenarthrobacter sp. Z7-10 TaxID=2787635 RepID=UPI0022A9C896|nr:hypothetical protein [Paenarthrobacter sp. Z7-10]